MDERTPRIDELLRHGDFLRALARRLLRDEHLAEDVVQETYAAAIARPPAHTGNLRGWLATVVRNLSLRRRRSEARHASHVRGLAAQGEEADAAETAARLETGRRLVGAVTELPEPYRTTVMRRWFDGLGPSEIARRSGIPVRTVETRLRRATAMLREQLLDEHDGSRRSLALALGLLARAPGPGIVPTTTAALAAGGTIMGKKLALAAVVLLAVGITWKYSFDEVPEPRPPEQGGALAAVRDAPTEKAGLRDGSEAEPVPIPGEVRLAGTVTEEETGKPVPGARVRAFDYQRAEVLETATDDDGRFEVPGTRGAAGAYHLLVSSEGWPRVEVVGARPAPEPLAIRLVAGGAISGRVTWGGSPVTAYRIAAVPMSFPAGGSFDANASLCRQVLPRDFVVATEMEVNDPEGRFRIRHLAAGRYALVVNAPGHQPRFENGGGRLDPLQGLDVGPGEEVEVEIALPSIGQFEFRVRDAESRSPIVDGVTFYIQTDVAGYDIETQVEPDSPAADGTYRLSLALNPRGTLDSAAILVTCEGYAPSRTSRGGYENGHRFDVDLVRPAAVRGTVRGTDGRPQADVILLVERSMEGRLLARARTDAAGDFLIEGLVPGDPIVVRGFDAALSRALFYVPITLRPGEIRELDIGGPETAAILGIATLEGRPCRGARLFLYSEDGRRLYAHTGADGRFRLEHIRPGRYELFADLTAPGGETVRLTRNLDLAEGERKVVEFEAGLLIEGVVVNAETGEPVPEGLTISARLVDGEEIVETLVLPGGLFRLRPNQEGTWELGCEMEEEWAPLSRPQIDLTREARRTGVRFELFPDPGDGRIVIQVVDAKKGTPVATGNCMYRHKITQGFPLFNGGRIELPDRRFDERWGLGEYHFTVGAEGYVTEQFTVVLTPAVKVREVTVRLVPSEAVEILAVGEGTQAEEIGLREGDLIVGHGGTRVRSVSELIRLADAREPSEPVTLELIRDGRKTTLKARGGPIGVTIANSGLE